MSFTETRYQRPVKQQKEIASIKYRIGGQIETIWNIPVILLRNYGGGSIILPPDNAVWLYALPFIYLSCVDSVAAQRAHTLKNINRLKYQTFSIGFAG